MHAFLISSYNPFSHVTIRNLQCLCAFFVISKEFYNHSLVFKELSLCILNGKLVEETINTLPRTRMRIDRLHVLVVSFFAARH
jgi:hypothetical protein